MKRIEDYLYLVIYLIIGGLVGSFLDLLLQVDFLSDLGFLAGSLLFFRYLEKRKSLEPLARSRQSSAVETFDITTALPQPASFPDWFVAEKQFCFAKLFAWIHR